MTKSISIILKYIKRKRSLSSLKSRLIEKVISRDGKAALRFLLVIC